MGGSLVEVSGGPRPARRADPRAVRPQAVHGPSADSVRTRRKVRTAVVAAEGVRRPPPGGRPRPLARGPARRGGPRPRRRRQLVAPRGRAPRPPPPRPVPSVPPGGEPRELRKTRPALERRG